MTHNPFKFMLHLFYYLTYLNGKRSDTIRYSLATERGYYCTGFNAHTGIAEFDPNRKPQEKPEIIKFKTVMTRLNKKEIK